MDLPGKWQIISIILLPDEILHLLIRVPHTFSIFTAEWPFFETNHPDLEKTDKSFIAKIQIFFALDVHTDQYPFKQNLRQCILNCLIYNFHTKTTLVSEIIATPALNISYSIHWFKTDSLLGKNTWTALFNYYLFILFFVSGSLDFFCLIPLYSSISALSYLKISGLWWDSILLKTRAPVSLLCTLPYS